MDEFETGVASVNIAYKRLDVVGNIVWKLRKLQTIATTLYQASTPAETTAIESATRLEVLLIS